MGNYLVISSDGHAGPPADHYREYLDPEYRAAFDEHQASTARMREAMQKARGAGDNSEFKKKWEAQTGGDGGLTAAYDSDRRNQVLDTEGIAAEVLFPDADVLGTGRIAASPFGSGLAGGAGNAPELALAGAKAHNRWLADFCALEPDRRIGIALVPILYDLDAAVAEIHDAHARGLRGVMIPTRWFDAPAYHHPRYDVVWQACEDSGMVLHTHSGAGPADYGEGRGTMAIYASEAYWWAARPLWVLLWAGVFERYPNLRYVVAENGAWWAPDLLRKMDEKYVGGHNTEKMGDAFRQELRMKPSDYFHRNCYLAASTPGVEDIDRRHEVGVRNLLWGNDLPHPEGTFPFTRYWIRERFRDLPHDETARILGENAADLYGVDRTALEPLVDEFGPSPDDVHGDVPLEPAPV